MKKFLAFLFLFAVCMPIFASFAFVPNFQLSLGGAFLHPTADYLKTVHGTKSPSFRSSFTFSGDLLPLNFRVNKFDFGGGVSFFKTSQSAAAGRHVIQAYSGKGIVIGGKYKFNNKFGLGVKGRLLFCEYKPYEYKFDVIETDIVPSVNVMDSDNFEVDLVTPVTFSFKSDAVTAKLQVGFLIQYGAVIVKDRSSGEASENAENSKQG